MRGSRLRGNDGGRSGVRRSGESFNSVAFGCFPLHPHPDPLPEGEGIIQGTGMHLRLHPHPSLLPSGRPLRNCACGRSSSHPPARYVCGGHPHTPAVGHRPSALLHSRGYASRPYELCKGLSREKGPDRLRGGHLTLTLSQRARGSEHLGVKFQISGSFGSIWPRLLLAARLKMRPLWPHFGTPLAHRSLVPLASMRPRWPRLASSGAARSGETFKTVSFGLIPSHSSLRLGLGFHPHPSLLPSREKGSDRLRENLSRWRHRRVGTESLGRGQAPVVYLGYARDRTG